MKSSIFSNIQFFNRFQNFSKFFGFYDFFEFFDFFEFNFQVYNLRTESGHEKIQTLDIVWTSTGDGHLWAQLLKICIVKTIISSRI